LDVHIYNAGLLYASRGEYTNSVKPTSPRSPFTRNLGPAVSLNPAIYKLGDSDNKQYDFDNRWMEKSSTILHRHKRTLTNVIHVNSCL